MKRFVAALLLLLITPQISIAAEVPKSFNFSGLPNRVIGQAPE